MTSQRHHPPRRPPHPLYKNKNTQRGGGRGRLHPPVHRSQQGLLIVTCARSAPSQSPVSQMHAGRSGPPPRLTAPAWQGGCRSGSGVRGGRKTAGGALAPDLSPVSAVPEPAEGEPRPLDLALVCRCCKVSGAACAGYPPFEDAQVCHAAFFPPGYA